MQTTIEAETGNAVVFCLIPQLSHPKPSYASTTLTGPEPGNRPLPPNEIDDDDTEPAPIFPFDLDDEFVTFYGGLNQSLEDPQTNI